MNETNKTEIVPKGTLAKARTGISGLDEITHGGLPAARPTLICGGPGCGKTVLAMEFLVRGASQFGEPGLFVSFEENKEDLYGDFCSFQFDIAGLEDKKSLAILNFSLSRDDLVDTGEFSLDGLFIRLDQGIRQVGAKRVAIDTIETLFSHLTNLSILRSELARLFRWLKDKGMTTVVTAERGDGALTRHGIEEYVSDCVLLLDHRVADNLSKRRIRVVKYRGSSHNADEFPFLIDAGGFSVLPLSAASLDYEVDSTRISSGIDDLDEMLEGLGYYRGSGIFVSGAAGAGKSTMASAFAASVCAGDERCLFFSFEESAAQLVRNMRSVGIDLGPATDSGSLVIHSSRPTLFGLEEHLVVMSKLINELQPTVVVMDPITDFLSVGSREEVRSMLVRIFDLTRIKRATTLVTNLLHGSGLGSDSGISSLMDTWIALRTDELDLNHTRHLQIIKSRGMAHSRDTREFVMSKSGISIRRLTVPASKQQSAEVAT